MARTKKDAEKPKEGATLSIDVDSFLRTRDSVVSGLATLQDAIKTLSSAYIKHTNSVLGEYGAGLDVDSALASLSNNPLLNPNALQNLRAISPPKSPAAETKKEKKKRVHDPNAPKRPLTPYFLYMQTARPIIAGDLGPEVAKGAVSAEGVRRWNAMIKPDKQLWTNAYNDNLRLYNARMHSYKAGNFTAKDMSDEDALSYAEHHALNVIAEPTADGQLAAEAMIDAPGEVDDTVPDPTPAPKATPKGGAKRNRKSGAKPAEPIVPAAIVPPPAPAPVEAAKEKSPEKKRKRAGKKDEVVESIEKEAAPASEKKPRKKKAKGDA